MRFESRAPGQGQNSVILSECIKGCDLQFWLAEVQDMIAY